MRLCRSKKNFNLLILVVRKSKAKNTKNYKTIFFSEVYFFNYRLSLTIDLSFSLTEKK